MHTRNGNLALQNDTKEISRNDGYSSETVARGELRVRVAASPVLAGPVFDRVARSSGLHRSRFHRTGDSDADCCWFKYDVEEWW